MLNFFDTQVSRLSLFFQNIAIIAFIILTTSVIYEVIARSVFNKPTIWSLEIVTYMISCVAFFGSAYVLRINKHLEINLLTQLFSNKYRRLMKIFSDTIGLLFCLIVLIYILIYPYGFPSYMYFYLIFQLILLMIISF